MLKPRTLDLAVGRWSGIFLHFGLGEQYLGKKHGPCPICNGGVDRYRYVDWEGTGSYFCSQCGKGYGIDLLMKLKGWDFKTATHEIDKIINNVKQEFIKTERSESEKVSYIKKVLKECRAVTAGDPVDLYLKRRVGAVAVPADLKYHPSLGHSDGGFHPAMIAIMRDEKGVGLTLHRTYLTASGEKANVTHVKKFMQGRKLNGGAIRLSGVQEVIGIAEGIESAMSASQRFNIPVWAASNSVLLEQWVPPIGVKEVVICGDNDQNYTGQAASFNLAKRLHRENLKVSVQIPERAGDDWNDVKS